MRISDIQINQRYIARVSGTLTTVRVLAIRETWSALAPQGSAGRTRKLIVAVNERTGRKLTFRSAARLQSKASPHASATLNAAASGGGGGA